MAHRTKPKNAKNTSTPSKQKHPWALRGAVLSAGACLQSGSLVTPAALPSWPHEFHLHTRSPLWDEREPPRRTLPSACSPSVLSARCDPPRAQGQAGKRGVQLGAAAPHSRYPPLEGFLDSLPQNRVTTCSVLSFSQSPARVCFEVLKIPAVSTHLPIPLWKIRVSPKNMQRPCVRS